jgi:ABC-type phosphate transport system substrate-binding protein
MGSLSTSSFSRACGCLLLLLAVLLPFGSVRAQIAVIAHKQVTEDSIDRTRLLDFYTGDIRRWEGGARVVVFDLKEKGETRDVFFEYVGKSSSRMRSIWLKRMLAGEGDPPEALETEADMVTKVAETPGAVGFIHRDRVNDSVKVLVIIDKKD